MLGIDWVLLADGDTQGANTIKEIKKCGYTEEQLRNRVRLTNERDIEGQLIREGFLGDYEAIVTSQIDSNINQLKTEGKTNEYVKEIIKLVQREKVENAYKLVERWKERNIQKEEIPSFVISFIEEVCKNE